jgi:hypothetical protein
VQLFDDEEEKRHCRGKFPFLYSDFIRSSRIVSTAAGDKLKVIDQARTRRFTSIVHLLESLFEESQLSCMIQAPL